MSRQQITLLMRGVIQRLRPRHIAVRQANGSAHAGKPNVLALKLLIASTLNWPVNARRSQPPTLRIALGISTFRR